MFDIKQFLTENQMTEYSRLNEDPGGAGEEAKKRGLVHVSFGRYADPSNPKKVVAKSVNGKLVKVDSDQDGGKQSRQPQEKPQRPDTSMGPQTKQVRSGMPEPWNYDQLSPKQKSTLKLKYEPIGGHPDLEHLHYAASKYKNDGYKVQIVKNDASEDDPQTTYYLYKARNRSAPKPGTWAAFRPEGDKQVMYSVDFSNPKLRAQAEDDFQSSSDWQHAGWTGPEDGNSGRFIVNPSARKTFEKYMKQYYPDSQTKARGTHAYGGDEF